MRIGVVGAGSWGTAISSLLAKKGYEVDLWAREPEIVEGINRDKRNPIYLRETSLPESINCSNDLGATVSGKELVVMAVPSRWCREVGEGLRDFLNNDAVILNLAKGFDPMSSERLSEILMGIFQGKIKGYAALSGPNHAEEVIREVPSATVIASQDPAIAKALQNIFNTSYFRVYTNRDVKGVEIGGAYKNVVAIAAGILDGMGLGDNTKASLITRGLAEMMRFGAALGANPITFTGLSGIGDLIVTCVSRHSRNRGLGEKIGRGMSLEEATRGSAMVVEGVSAVQIALPIARKKGVEIPIAEVVYQVLFSGLSPQKAMENLMSRQPREETDEELYLFPVCTEKNGMEANPHKSSHSN